MTTRIYTQADNEQLAEAIGRHLPSTPADEPVLVADTPVAEETVASEDVAAADTPNADAPAEGIPESLQMYTNIRQIFDGQVSPQIKATYFTVGKGAVAFNLDSSSLAPNPITRLAGKRVEEAFVRQCESHIFNDQSELDPERLLGLIFLMDHIKKGQTPIRIVTGEHRHMLPKLVAGLNAFFNQHYATLASIHVMFTGSTAFAPKTPVEEEV